MYMHHVVTAKVCTHFAFEFGDGHVNVPVDLDSEDMISVQHCHLLRFSGRYLRRLLQRHGPFDSCRNQICSSQTEVDHKESDTSLEHYLFGTSLYWSLFSRLLQPCQNFVLVQLDRFGHRKSRLEVNGL